MTAWLLPGQGAQAPGMGAGLMESAVARSVFHTASHVLGIDVARLATQAGKEEVDDAFNAQALAMAMSVACGRVLLERGVRPRAIVGFSLGQISAMALSGALSLEDAFALLKVRAAAMAQACGQRLGAMTAVMGLSPEAVEDLVEDSAQGAVLVVANCNCPGQRVVSGDVAAIGRLEAAVRAGRGKCVRLNTAGAFHSPLMHDAAQVVEAACRGLDFHEPKVPVICNTDARPFQAREAGRRLASQVESPVLFEQSVRLLLSQGHREFVEVGYGKVLSGLVRKMDRSATCRQVATERDAIQCAAECAHPNGEGGIA